METHILSTAEEVFSYGEHLAKKYKILLLQGVLGAGKTLLTKGFAKGLGIDPNVVQSPTYTYINIYDNTLLHMDLYRLDSLEELTQKGILDQVSQFDYMCIEWPKFTEYLDIDDAVDVLIEKIPEGRKISILPL